MPAAHIQINCAREIQRHSLFGGRGPGDAGLLTLRGAELLRLAEVVIGDVLVNPELFRLAPASAEIISRGNHKRDGGLTQEQLTELMLARAREGKTVVRLKGGDPFIFGRGGEEAERLAAEKIPFEVVPGVSSVVAAANYAGIPLTHREHCSSFTVFTGHSDSADAPTALRYEQIAKIPGTKVVLMGMDNLADWTKSLIAHGMARRRPWPSSIAARPAGRNPSPARSRRLRSSRRRKNFRRPPSSSSATW